MASHSSILTWRIPFNWSLEGYSQWGRKESDMTEWLSMTQHRPVARRVLDGGRDVVRDQAHRMYGWLTPPPPPLEGPGTAVEGHSIQKSKHWQALPGSQSHFHEIRWVGKMNTWDLSDLADSSRWPYNLWSKLEHLREWKLMLLTIMSGQLA